ncbi:MAG TPA: extracellular solute-binding protein [Terrimicrobiaceae bacterium]|nr:extracellular solute-binding protein [Terrimicrobiaceae bacterium]
MKWVILGIVGVLILASFGVFLTRQRTEAGGPPVFMTGSPGTEMNERLGIFREWQKARGGAAINLQLDAVNSGMNKVIMQGVSGMAADLIQANGSADLGYYSSIGLLADLGPYAEKGGYRPDRFLPAIRNELVVDGKQFGCPVSIYLLVTYINRATFENLGLEVPPPRMTWEDFERRGKEFVAKANPPGQKPRRFFVSGVNTTAMRRSLGLDTFNETLTRCTLDDPRNTRVLKLIQKWTVEDRLIPTGTDMAALVSDGDAGVFGPRLYQFKIGNIAMITGGNYLTPALRRLGSLPLAVTMPPYAEFPNAILGAQMLAIYTGSKNAAAATEYLEFLQSEEYFATILRHGDGIPTTAEKAHRSDYLRPPDHPNEWGCNEEIIRCVEEGGFPYTVSPFAVFGVYNRIDTSAIDRFMTGLITAEEAGARAAAEINDEIALNLERRPALRAKHKELVAIQARIEERRSRGEKVPREWIRNPFLKAYYEFQGWCE